MYLATFLPRNWEEKIRKTHSEIQESSTFVAINHLSGSLWVTSQWHTREKKKSIFHFTYFEHILPLIRHCIRLYHRHFAKFNLSIEIHKMPIRAVHNIIGRNKRNDNLIVSTPFSESFQVNYSRDFGPLKGKLLVALSFWAFIFI